MQLVLYFINFLQRNPVLPFPLMHFQVTRVLEKCYKYIRRAVGHSDPVRKDLDVGEMNCVLDC